MKLNASYIRPLANTSFPHLRRRVQGREEKVGNSPLLQPYVQNFRLSPQRGKMWLGEKKWMNIWEEAVFLTILIFI
jgi:hypothetical protein